MAARDFIATVTPRVLRRLTGCSISAPGNWRREGIPSRHYRTIKEWCDGQGIDCPMEAFNFAEAVDEAGQPMRGVECRMPAG